MMILVKLKTVVVLVTILFSPVAFALDSGEQHRLWQLKDLQADESDYLRNTSGDGYLVLDQLNLSRAQACGLMLNLTFKTPLPRAAIFDVYWRTAQAGFSENHKGFFIINQTQTDSSQRFLIPLCKLYGISGNLNTPAQQQNIIGLRIDYPPNHQLSIKFETIQLLSSAEMVQLLASEHHDVMLLEPYERISAHAFTSLDVIVPKLVFIVEEGLQRLSKDTGFLVFWLLLIAVLTIVIVRSYIKE